MADKKDKTQKKGPYRSFGFKPSRTRDAELIAFLEEKENVNAYIKELIYNDMKKK